MRGQDNNIKIDFKKQGASVGNNSNDIALEVSYEYSKEISGHKKGRIS